MALGQPLLVIAANELGHPDPERVDGGVNPGPDAQR